MTPSQRITHIKAIAAALSSDDWTLIDLTLSQFGIHTTNWDNANRSAYVIDRIQGVTDLTLLDLAKHLGTASELESIEQPTFWTTDDARLFLSHLSTIKKSTSTLKDALAEYGIRGFVAHSDIEPTMEWQTEIETALSTMDALAALLSPGFNESKWCDQEVGVAIGRRVPIVPLKIDMDPYGLFGKYQAIQAKGKSPTEAANLIFLALIGKPQIGPKITSKLVSMLTTSPQWAESRRLISLIEKSSYVTPSHIASLKKALDENGEVRNAHQLPEKIAALEKKFVHP